MRILYGVQATGNGHISRAHAMSKHLDLNTTDFIFSGRDRSEFFDMDCFGDWQCLSGLSFAFKNGKVDNFATLKSNRWRQFYHDVKKVQKQLHNYDVVISDFEPVTAWAAKLSGKTCIGIGHQYAFDYNVPKSGNSLLSRSIMRHFAPVTLGLGLHWHHFGQTILPPIIEINTIKNCLKDVDRHSKQKNILVYLGFENRADVIRLLEPFKEINFWVYGSSPEHLDPANIRFKAPSRDGFHQDLHQCDGVICNAGFELASEALSLGKKLLVKPLQGQTEQESNAKALVELNLGQSMTTLKTETIKLWLQNDEQAKINYPDVAEHIVSWLHQKNWQDCSDLSARLWRLTSATGNAHFCDVPSLKKITA